MSKRHSRRLNQIPRFLWIVVMSITIFYVTFTYIELRIPYNPFGMESSDHTHKEYLIKTVGCKIPDLPVFSESLAKYLNYEFDGAHCNRDIPPLVESTSTSLMLLHSNFDMYEINDVRLLHCCYEELKRKIPRGSRDDRYEFGGVCVAFQESIDVEKEFVHVKCHYEGEKIYEDFFAFIPRKSNTSINLKPNDYNVLVIGLDSISRLNLHRQMKQSAKILEELGFVEFFGYNKIADNTYPNLIAVLTGKNGKAIRETCRKSTVYFDNCSFIWDHFKAKNYTTSFAEDSARMGIFNFENFGFQKQPTDYMWGFFDRIAEKLLGNSASINVVQCIGPREAYKMLAQYISDFVSQMESWTLPYFAFFWSASLSHDELNKPRVGDELYRNLLHGMFTDGYFQKTVVIFMSDHGMRFGPFRETYQGRIEERLPFLFIRLPKDFRDEYSLATSNLKKNTKMLTTPFDLHETLFDIASPNNLMNEFVEGGRRKSKSGFGLSLFQRIEPTRTCEEAGIADHWCTCLRSAPVQVTRETGRLFTFTIDYINEMLQNHEQCERLRIRQILNVEILYHPENSMGSQGKIKEFLINFQTLPGNGIFEATVRQISNKKMEIVDSISRLNLYGQQSNCITDVHLKLYCYCKKRKSHDDELPGGDTKMSFKTS